MMDVEEAIAAYFELINEALEKLHWDHSEFCEYQNYQVPDTYSDGDDEYDITFTDADVDRYWHRLQSSRISSMEKRSKQLQELASKIQNPLPVIKTLKDLAGPEFTQRIFRIGEFDEYCFLTGSNPKERPSDFFGFVSQLIDNVSLWSSLTIRASPLLPKTIDDLQLRLFEIENQDGQYPATEEILNEAAENALWAEAVLKKTYILHLDSNLLKNTGNKSSQLEGETDQDKPAFSEWIKTAKPGSSGVFPKGEFRRYFTATYNIQDRKSISKHCNSFGYETNDVPKTNCFKVTLLDNWTLKAESD